MERFEPVIRYQAVRNVWESQFFGREIAHLVASAEDLPHQAWQLIQAKVATTEFEQIVSLQQQGFCLVETEVVFSLSLSPSVLEGIARSHTLSFAKPTQLKALLSQFSSAFADSRFRPPYFSREENQRFYTKWIENAVNGVFDHCCMIEEISGEPAGIVTLRIENYQACIGLLAVAEKYRRQGVGTRLLQYAQAWAVEQGATFLEIRTQLSNRSAIALYQSAGAELVGSYYWFYCDCGRVAEAV